MAYCRFKNIESQKVITGENQTEVQSTKFTMSSWASWRDKRCFSSCTSSKSIKLKARSMKYLQPHNRKNNVNMNCFKMIAANTKR